ncbi:MAG: DMT family transporter, partial [Arenicellales bacterium]|nr:DMT family transporter [Arenicellales bacterium]
FGLPLLCLLVHFEGGLSALKTNRPQAHVLRYLLVLTLSFTFFWALSQMKLVDAVALSFAAPIFIAGLSVPVLKESVGWHRWAAIGIGFCGVLVMLRPGMGVFQWAAVVVLCSALAYALLAISTRAFKSTESTASLVLYPQLGVSLTGLILIPHFWITPSLSELGLFALAGIFGSVGIICLTQAFRLAPVAVVSPFEYTALIWATLLGFLMWNELPDLPTLVGATIVSASGLYIIYRETIKVGRVRPKLPSMSPDDTGL